MASLQPESAEILGEAYFQDPHRVHDRLRAAGPVTPVQMPEGTRAWMVTGYADVRAALADRRLCNDWRTVVSAAERDRAPEPTLKRDLLALDPPDHTRLRRLVTRALTARRMAGLRPRIEEITRALLDELAASPDGETDLLAAFALPLPVTVISELLGVPVADRQKFRTWSATVVSSVATQPELETTYAELTAYFSALLETKRRSLGDDLLSALIQDQENDGDRLTTGELISMAFLMLVAGHETTVNLIARGMLTLLLNPAVHARLRADRSLLPAAIEEMLRYISPLNHSLPRYTAEPVSIGGVDIPARQVVLLSLSSANWDSSRFASPGTFDIDRDHGGHIAFGHGIHFCLGAPLARLEAEVAFAGLLDRFPHMTLAVSPAQLRWCPSTLIHALEDLPVRLGSFR
jgi:cytochrome P450